MTAMRREAAGHEEVPNQNARGGWAPHSPPPPPERVPATGRPGSGDLTRWRSKVKLYQLAVASGRNGWGVAVRLNSQNEYVAPSLGIHDTNAKRRIRHPLRA